MMDEKIKEIPTEELEKDLNESIIDIEYCRLALINCVVSYSGGSVKDRLKTNMKIVKIIREELKKRVNRV